MAWIQQGLALDTADTRILQTKSEVLDPIQQDTLPILKYPCMIGGSMIGGSIVSPLEPGDPFGFSLGQTT